MTQSVPIAPVAGIAPHAVGGNAALSAQRFTADLEQQFGRMDALLDLSPAALRDKLGPPVPLDRLPAEVLERAERIGRLNFRKSLAEEDSHV